MSMKRGRPVQSETHKIAEQVKAHSAKTVEAPPKKYAGSDTKKTSTGSTLLDLAISGGRFEGGGLPAGIVVEIFGPSGIGKTVLLCEIAGGVQRLGGEVKFHDPEGRLNTTFARLFDLKLDDEDILHPDIPTEIFKPIRSWDPKPPDKIHGVFADSLAALESDLELEDKKDEYSRRAKLFSQEFRKTCRVIAKKEFLVCCSNQIRANVNAGAFEEKFSSPGGQAIGFYSSLRLRVSRGAPFKIKKVIKKGSKENSRTIGIKTNVEVYKSTVWKPYQVAPIYILFDYGIDDIRANLQFVKSQTQATVYQVNNLKLEVSIDKSIRWVEEDQLEEELRKQTIALWHEEEALFKQNRTGKRRWT